MKAEIIAIGTELLMGQIVNTNAQFLSQQCASLGIDVYFQTVVGDNRERLLQAIRHAESRANLILCTGGLGPTQDDLTKDVIAEYVERGLVYHKPTMERMVSFFERRGIPMVDSNKRQALLIEGSEPLMNDTGLAVGLAMVHHGLHIVLLPGPPKEMKPMFEVYAKPWLASKMGGNDSLYSKILKFAGIGESGLEHQLIDLIKEQQDPTIAPYAKEGEVTLRITTRAATEQEAWAKMHPTESAIRNRVGQYLYAEQELSIEQVILDQLAERRQTLSSVESCTGGLLGEMLTAIPGSSRAYAGGMICYSNAMKHRLLDVPMDLLEGENAPGAVSSETALCLAENLLKRTGTNYSLSITGVAGPAHSESKPVGLVYVALAEQGKPTVVEKLELFGSREIIRLRAVKHLLYRLWQRLNVQ